MLNVAVVGTGWWGMERGMAATTTKDAVSIAGCSSLSLSECAAVQAAFGGDKQLERGDAASEPYTSLAPKAILGAAVPRAIHADHPNPAVRHHRHPRMNREPRRAGRFHFPAVVHIRLLDDAADVNAAAQGGAPSRGGPREPAAYHVPVHRVPLGAIAEMTRDMVKHRRRLQLADADRR